MSFLPDTDWLVDALIGRPNAVAAIAQLRSQGLAVSIVSSGEVFAGAVRAPDAHARFAEFRAFLGRFVMVPLSDPVMEVFANTRADLRRTGRLIPDMDLLIAATALHHDLSLVTRNRRHVERVPDGRLYASLPVSRWRRFLGPLVRP
jgi:predicted nucleic acid-binding protein